MKRTTALGSIAGAFIDRALGVSGTKITAKDMNAHQDEIVNAIIAAGLTPSDATNSQLSQAIQAIATSARDAAINSARDAAIPVGFLYTQLPGMSAPATLWPWATWANESATFAGAFFRAEGGKASVFGSGVQTDAFQLHGHELEDNSGNTVTSRSITSGGATEGPSPDGSADEWALTRAGDPITQGSGGTPRTADETRPTNYTVRIWRRTA